MHANAMPASVKITEHFLPKQPRTVTPFYSTLETSLFRPNLNPLAEIVFIYSLFPSYWYMKKSFFIH